MCPFYMTHLTHLKLLLSFAQVWVAIGTASSRQDVVAEGHAMLNESAAVQTDLEASMERSRIPAVNGSDNGVACVPHVAGWTCGRGHPVGRTDYKFPTLDVYCTGRTYPEAMYSGVLPAGAVADIVDWASVHSQSVVTIVV